jgi:predicted transcriptional regulator
LRWDYLVQATVKDIFKRDFVSILENDTISKCFHLFKEDIPPVLAVFDKENRYKGVLARRWIIRSTFDPLTTKVKKIMRTAPAVNISDSLSRVARLMIESEIRQLPVYSGGKLLGFVSDEDIIQCMIIGKWGYTKVSEIMTKKPFIVNNRDSIGTVLSLFREHDISHIPVVSDKKLVGIISIHDIIVNIFQPRQRQARGEMLGKKIPVLNMYVEGIMTKPAITVFPETRIRKVVNIMKKFNISSVVVVKQAIPIGILTKRDLLEPISQLEKISRRFTIQFSTKDVKINEIQKGFIMDEFDSFTKRYSKTLRNGKLFVYMKTHGISFKGEQLIHCRLKLRTVKGSFFSSNEGYGIEQTYHIALDRLERQILSSKKFEHNPKFVQNYLKRIRFPLSDL